MSARQLPFYLCTLLVQAITFVLRPTAIYRAIEIDVPAQWLGVLGASFALVPLVLAVPAGHATDRFGEKRLMVVGAGVVLTSAACFTFFATGVPGLLAASVLLGVGHLCSVVGQQALVANNTASDRYDTAFGHYTFAASAGQAAGPGLIVFFGGSSAIPATDVIFLSALGLAATLLVTTMLLTGGAGRIRGSDSPAGSMLELVQRPGLISALTVSCVVLAAVDISLVYLPVLGTEREIAAGIVGALLTVRAAMSMASRFFLGKLVVWIGRTRLLVGSVLLAAAGMALAPVPMPIWMVFLVVAAMGFGLGVGQPMTMSWLAEATPPGLRGRAMSLRLTGNRLGQVVVPSVAGMVAIGTGAAGVLWFTAVALLAVGVLSRRLGGGQQEVAPTD